MKPLHKMTRKELDKEWTRISVIGRFIPAAETLDISDAMTPEEIESAEKAEREYRRKFAVSGGSAKSPRKAAASRMNGKKGGRPRNAIPPLV